MLRVPSEDAISSENSQLYYSEAEDFYYRCASVLHSLLFLTGTVWIKIMMVYMITPILVVSFKSII